MTYNTFSHKKIIENKLYKKIIQLKIKRSLDILLSLIFIIALSPLFLIISFIIKITSKGPVFYTNERVGLFGKHFNCYKFRSMKINQHQNKKDIQAHVEAQKHGNLYKLKVDTRITWVGKLIRKTSIDELPQLVNVFMGDMSIVGPRPLVPFMLNNLEEFKNIRSLLKPGITGKWQIEDRINNTSAHYMIKHDISYIEEYSLFADLKILLKTPKVVISTKGAF